MDSGTKHPRSAAQRYAWRLALLLVVAAAVWWLSAAMGAPFNPYRSYYTWRNESVLRELPRLDGAAEEQRTVSSWCNGECLLPQGYVLGVRYRLAGPRTPAAIRDFFVAHAPPGWEVRLGMNPRAEFLVAYCRGSTVVTIGPNPIGDRDAPTPSYGMDIGYDRHRPGHVDACHLSTTSSARPEVPPEAALITRQQAFEALRANATEASPLLFPHAVPTDWTVHLLIDPHGAAPDELSLWFRDPQQSKLAQLSISGSNALSLTTDTVTTDPNFRGDPKSYYRVVDARNPRSDRKLVWFEPGTPASHGGTGYSLTSAGLTDEEFWRLADSLERVSPD